MQEKLEYAIMLLLDNILTKEKQTKANRIVLNPVSYRGADACCPGNPRDTSVEEIAALYRSLM